MAVGIPFELDELREGKSEEVTEPGLAPVIGVIGE
jgi:hypothetical protein